jgi:hypothetical protein
VTPMVIFLMIMHYCHLVNLGLQMTGHHSITALNSKLPTCSILRTQCLPRKSMHTLPYGHLPCSNMAIHHPSQTIEISMQPLMQYHWERSSGRVFCACIQVRSLKVVTHPGWTVPLMYGTEIHIKWSETCSQTLISHMRWTFDLIESS